MKRRSIVGRIKPIPVFILICIIVATTYFFFKPTYVNDCYSFYNYELRGKVESYQTGTVAAENKFGEWVFNEEELVMSEKIFFDQKGNLLSSENYDVSSGKLAAKSVMKYEDGIAVELTNYDADGKVETVGKREVYEGDDSDLAALKQKFGRAATLYRTSHYTREGELEYYSNGVVKKRQLVMIELFDASDQVMASTEYKTDNNGFLVQAKSIYPNEDGERVIEYHFENIEFDEKGNWVKRLITDNDNNDPVMQIRKIKYY